MVRLHRDPDGEHVFTAREEVMQMTTALGGPQQATVTPQLPDDDSIDLLKRKIQQMEDIIKEYKVAKTNFPLYTISLYILTESPLILQCMCIPYIHYTTSLKIPCCM